MDITRRLRSLLCGSLLMIAFVAAAPAAQAQQAPPPVIGIAAPGQLQELVLRDGTRAIGRVEKVESGRVTFRTEGGALMEVDIAQVVSADVAKGRIVNSAFWPEDSNPTRLFFAPTGRSLKKGEAYVGLYEIYLPFVQYGVTDRFSIGGGTPFYIGGGERPFWFTPKLQIIDAPTTQVAIGAMHFLNIDNESVGIGYAALTKGSPDSAVTVGVGWTYDIGNSGGTAVLMIGGEHRTSRRTKFVTENYIVEGHGLLSGGFRIMGERLSTDVSLMAPLDADVFILLPLVNFVWKFAK